MSSGREHSKAPEPLTDWKAKNMNCHQAGNIARHQSHSPSGKPRVGVVSRLKTHKTPEPLTY